MCSPGTTVTQRRHAGRREPGGSRWSADPGGYFELSHRDGHARRPRCRRLRENELEYLRSVARDRLVEVGGQSVFRIGHLGAFNDLMLMGTLCGVEMGLEPRRRATQEGRRTGSDGCTLRRRALLPAMKRARARSLEATKSSRRERRTPLEKPTREKRRLKKGPQTPSFKADGSQSSWCAPRLEPGTRGLKVPCHSET